MIKAPVSVEKTKDKEREICESDAFDNYVC
jgi:hypothetical protein